MNASNNPSQPAQPSSATPAPEEEPSETGVEQQVYGGNYDDEDHVVDLDDPEAMEC